MDLIEIVGLLGLVLAGICIAGMVLNWNKPNPRFHHFPMIRFTRIGWLLAILVVVILIAMLLIWRKLIPGVRIWRPGRIEVFVMVTSGILAFFFMRQFLMKLGIKLTHDDIPSLPEKHGSKVSGNPGEVARGRKQITIDPSLRGQKGIAVTSLFPNGSIRIDGKDYEAISAEGLIEQGATIIVVQVSSLTLIVQRCSS